MMNVRVAIFDSWTSLAAGAVGLFSPGRAGRFRLGREMYKRSFFDAGSLKGSDKNWREKSKSADTEIYKESGLIVDRCRDLARNNVYIKEALRKITNNVVRGGITPQARLRNPSGTLETKLNAQLEATWKRHSKRRYIDSSGHDSQAAIQKLVLRHMWFDGELFVRRIWSKDLAKLGVIPFHVELLERDYLAKIIHGVQKNGNLAKHGIEYNKLGKPVAYHFYIGHPGDDLLIMARETHRVDASDVLHVYERERASQGRGLSWLVAVIMEVYSFGEYQSTERIGARLAAAFGIFIKTAYPEMYGEGNRPDFVQGGGTTDLPGGSPTDKKMEEHIGYGRIDRLPDNTTIELASHNRPGTQYGPYVKTSLKTQSLGPGLSYSSYSHDYSDSSYSADRSAKLEERLGFKGQQMFLAEKFLEPLWQWAMEGMWVAGLMPMPGYATDPDRWWDCVEWQNPGWTWVDPLKDSKAAANDLLIGITTHKKLAAARGEDWDEIIDQAIIEEKKLVELRKLREENKDA